MKMPIPLNALRAFEASARHQSFSSAAAELNVTPAAVGQLVRSLEDQLGTPLFIRNTSGRKRLVPTEAALRALPEIRSGFDKLQLGLERLKEDSTGNVLTVTVSPAFAAKWLLPRFERFHDRYPDTDVRLETSLKPIDFLARRVDVGVRYGTGSWQGVAAEKLMDEEIYPVCAPELLPYRALGHDLRHVTLIHDLSMDGHAGFPTWDKWLEQAGMKDVPASRGMRINNSAAVLQAAIEGHGVALARSAMAGDDLAAGRLVRLFPEIRFVSELAYYIVYRPECVSLPRLVMFKEWLMSEAAGQSRSAGLAASR
ncbi:transcriptional regulator GcvA [Stutzerimonas stutzeri]